MAPAVAVHGAPWWRHLVGWALVVLISFFVRSVFIDVQPLFWGDSAHGICLARAQRHLTQSFGGDASVETGIFEGLLQALGFGDESAAGASHLAVRGVFSPTTLLSSSLAHSAVWWHYSHTIPVRDWYARVNIRRLKQRYLSVLLQNANRHQTYLRGDPGEAAESAARSQPLRDDTPSPPEGAPLLPSFVYGQSGGRGEGFTVAYPLRFAHYYLEGAWVAFRLRSVPFWALLRPHTWVPATDAPCHEHRANEADPGGDSLATPSSSEILESLILLGFLRGGDATPPRRSEERLLSKDDVITEMLTVHCMLLGFISEFNFLLAIVTALPATWLLGSAIVSMMGSIRQGTVALSELLDTASVSAESDVTVPTPTAVCFVASLATRVLVTSLLFGTVMLLPEIDVCSGLVIPLTLLLWATYFALREEGTLYPVAAATGGIAHTDDPSGAISADMRDLQGTTRQVPDPHPHAHVPCASLLSMLELVKISPRPLWSSGRVFFFPVAAPSSKFALSFLVLSALACAHTVWLFFFFPVAALWYGTCCHRRAHVRVVARLNTSTTLSTARVRALLFEDDDDDDLDGAMRSYTNGSQRRDDSRSPRSGSSPRASNGGNGPTSPGGSGNGNLSPLPQGVDDPQLSFEPIGMSSYFDSYRMSSRLALGISIVFLTQLLVFFPFARFDPAQYMDVFDLLVPTVDYGVLTSVPAAAPTLSSWAAAPSSPSRVTAQLGVSDSGGAAHSKADASGCMKTPNADQRGEQVFDALTSLAWLNNTCMSGGENACLFPTSNFWFVTDYYLGAPWLRLVRCVVSTFTRSGAGDTVGGASGGATLEVETICIYGRMASLLVGFANTLPVLALILYRLHRPPVHFCTVAERLRSLTLQSNEQLLDVTRRQIELEIRSGVYDPSRSSLGRLPAVWDSTRYGSTTSQYNGAAEVPQTITLLSRDEYVLKQFLVLMWAWFHCSLVCYLYLLQPGRLSVILPLYPATLILVVCLAYSMVGYVVPAVASPPVRGERHNGDENAHGSRREGNDGGGDSDASLPPKAAWQPLPQNLREAELRSAWQIRQLLYPLSDIMWLCAYGFYLALAVRPMWRVPPPPDDRVPATSTLSHGSVLHLPSFSSLVRFSRLVPFVFGLFVFSLITGRRAWERKRSSQVLLVLHVSLLAVLVADVANRFAAHVASRGVVRMSPYGSLATYIPMLVAVCLENTMASVIMKTAAASLVFFMFMAAYSTWKLIRLALHVEEA